MQDMWVQSLDQEESLEKEMASHSIILAWKSPRAQKPGQATVNRITKVSDMT